MGRGGNYQATGSKPRFGDVDSIKDPYKALYIFRACGVIYFVDLLLVCFVFEALENSQ